ncbi:DUF3137 domain-containing protein [Flavobacterium sp. I3-2]|uniref:DUF3137 domain-containing protein n=1 Tax=Flavobacterium sp. I3-2 TaxID=2748319 RepID=UPI0015AE58A6|nr:DUF3137 domain-containing protein [Flavobacterium sp. I3-2]
MNLQEAKYLITRESEREKRITIRNVIAVAILISIVIALVLKYAMPQLKSYIDGISTDADLNSNNFGNYYKIIIPIAIIASLYYPVKNLIDVKNRRKKIEKVFDLLSEGNECEIYANHTQYLTVIPIFKIKLKLNPVHYMEIAINGKNYSLPVVEKYLPDVIRVFSNANLEYFQKIISELYGNAEIKEDYKTDLKPLTEFQTFTQKEFAAEIAQMEKGRSKSKNMLYLQTILAFVFVGVVIWFSNRKGGSLFTNSNQVFILIGAFVLITSMIGFGFMMYHKKTASGGASFTNFKKSIFSRLIVYVNPKFHYIEKAYVGLPEIMHSNLFDEKDYSITGGDQIIGHYNGVAFQSCNLILSYRRNFTNEKTPDDYVFGGSYFVARFPKKFKGCIRIHPKKGFFGSLKGNDISSYINKTGEVVRLEDPEFQKQFEVYADDQILVRYILTPVFMERLKEINTRNKGEVYIAINESNIVIATNRINAIATGSTPYDMLSVKINMKLLDDIYTELIEQLTVIDTLKLNHEIWKN